MKALVREWQAGNPCEPATAEGVFAIIITPWLATAVPWFSIVAGLLLSRTGERVVFVMDDMPFGANPVRFRFISVCIRRVLRVVARTHSVAYLSDYCTPGGDIPEDLIGRLAALNAVHALRGEITAQGRARYIELISSQLRRSGAAIERVISRLSPRAIFIPGGIYGSTGLWVDLARRSGVRVASHDSGGYGILMLATDGIAAQLQDVPRAFRLLKESAGFPAEKPFILANALSELEKRRSGTDTFSSQIKSAGGPPPEHAGAILLPLNSSWDQAALGLHAVFAGNTEWIVETVRWVLDSTQAKIIVRQHPCERLEAARSSDDYRHLLHTNFGNHPRLQFIAAEDPINTYELLKIVSVVIAYTSTVGVEAAALGKPVITASRSYYSQLGFVWSADNRSRYFELVERALAGNLVPTAAMREDALCCYYLAQVCNWIHSPFNPEAYDAWSARSLEELSQEPAVRLTIASLHEDYPAAVLNHRAKFRDNAFRQTA